MHILIHQIQIITICLQLSGANLSTFHTTKSTYHHSNKFSTWMVCILSWNCIENSLRSTWKCYLHLHGWFFVSCAAQRPGTIIRVRGLRHVCLLQTKREVGAWNILFIPLSIQQSINHILVNHEQSSAMFLFSTCNFPPFWLNFLRKPR